MSNAFFAFIENNISPIAIDAACMLSLTRRNSALIKLEM